MRPYDKEDGTDVTPLVDAFFANDPYYPRPVPGHPLYDIFRQAYLRSCGTERRKGAELFLRSIEERQTASRTAPVA